jgi:hypothetical protein
MTSLVDSVADDAEQRQAWPLPNAPNGPAGYTAENLNIFRNNTINRPNTKRSSKGTRPSSTIFLQPNKASLDRAPRIKKAVWNKYKDQIEQEYRLGGKQGVSRALSWIQSQSLPDLKPTCVLFDPSMLLRRSDRFLGTSNLSVNYTMGGKCGNHSHRMQPPVRLETQSQWPHY